MIVVAHRGFSGQVAESRPNANTSPRQNSVRPG
jgi:hypothetical protein